MKQKATGWVNAEKGGRDPLRYHKQVSPVGDREGAGVELGKMLHTLDRARQWKCSQEMGPKFGSQRAKGADGVARMQFLGGRN